MSEYLCPVCQEGHLELEISDAPNMPYTVTCPFCGTKFEHERLHQGFNAAHQFIQDLDFVGQDPEQVENWAYDEKTTRECSGCLKRRTYVKGEPPFRFCPDCGRPVASNGTDDG